MDQEKTNVINIDWNQNQNAEIKTNEQGVYFLQTSLTNKVEATIWKIYNSLRDTQSADEYLLKNNKKI